MTKKLRKAIDEANEAIGKKYPQIGAFQTYTRGFGQRNDLKIGTIVNTDGGVSYFSEAHLVSFRKALVHHGRMPTIMVDTIKAGDRVTILIPNGISVGMELSTSRSLA